MATTTLGTTTRTPRTANKPLFWAIALAVVIFLAIVFMVRSPTSRTMGTPVDTVGTGVSDPAAGTAGPADAENR